MNVKWIGKLEQDGGDTAGMRWRGAVVSMSSNL